MRFWDASAIVPPVRYGNRTQILGKTFLVSRTQERVSKAGRASEAARESMKQMRELKRDMEYAFTRNQISTAGGSMPSSPTCPPCSLPPTWSKLITGSAAGSPKTPSAN